MINNIVQINSSKRMDYKAAKAASAYGKAMDIPGCRVCRELEVNLAAAIAVVTIDDGLLPFSCNITYCPVCGNKIKYGRKG